MCDFCKQLERLCVAGCTGEHCPPHTRLGGPSQGTTGHKGSRSQGLRAPSGPCALCMCIPSPGASLPGSFSEALRRRVFKHPCQAVLRRWGRSLRHVSTLPQCSVLSHPSPAPLSPPGPEVPKTTRTFCLEVPQQWEAPISALLHLSLNQTSFNGGKLDQEEKAASPVSAPWTRAATKRLRRGLGPCCFFSGGPCAFDGSQTA